MRTRAQIHLDSFRKKLTVMEADTFPTNSAYGLTREHVTALREAHRLISEAVAGFKKADDAIQEQFDRVVA